MAISKIRFNQALKILSGFCLVASIVLVVQLTAAEPKGLKADEKTVNVYSYRQPFLIEPLFKEFKKETGIVVNVLFAKKGLIERIALEGSTSPADLLLTTDIGQMFQAAESVGASITSPILQRNVPSKYRDKGNKWFALTKRARAFFVLRDNDNYEDASYEDLGSSEFDGKICMRDAQHAYNIALIAAHIAHHGSDKTRTWLEGLKQNLARRPTGNDRLQIKGVFAGECQLALANTYYMGNMLRNIDNPEQIKWARSVQIVFPRFNIEDGGTHINFSGMVAARFSRHKANAIKLMEFLSSPKAQLIYARDNFEFPINRNTPASSLVRSWGRFTDDKLTPSQIAAHRGEASLLVDETDLND